MSEDIRVLLVKLADRLHNMRTLHHLDSEAKRRAVAAETMEIYAPLAERIGMERIKDELEELAFAHLNPDAVASIEARLEVMRQAGEDAVPGIVESMSQTLRARGVEAEVSGRRKQLHSIWRKMQRKNVGFEQLSDLIAFRVVVATTEDCYRALGIIHTTYPVVPEQFDDYISTPKTNGYRSLHTCVIGPDASASRCRSAPRRCTRSPSTESPHTGATSRQRRGPTVGSTAGCATCSTSSTRPRARRSSSSTQSSRCSRTRCSASPRRAISSPCRAVQRRSISPMPSHSEVGDRCIGAKINGRMMPLRSQLNNGDQIEIITSETGTPAPAWEDMVVTGRARARIRRFIRNAQRRGIHPPGQGDPAEELWRGRLQAVPGGD